MLELKFLLPFLERLDQLQAKYVITGSVASIMYGEPRLTHDIDIVLDFTGLDPEEFVRTFPLEDFYCPPLEILVVEIKRNNRAHFNLIHHETGYKADIYLAGNDELHTWALSNRKEIEVDGLVLFVAPPEYVIIRKMEYFGEGGSEKHIRDIQGILTASETDINTDLLQEELQKRGLKDLWEQHFK